MPKLLQLTLFGSPEVRLHGQPVTGFRTSKAQALLYYLAVTGRPHTRATLAGLLWGDQPETAARSNLSKALSNLRDLVGDAVLIERHTAAFNQDYPYDLDTERFAAAVGQPPTVESSQALQAALTLYRGDLLEGFYVREAPDFEQWLLVQRAHYREAVITGLHALAGFHEQDGDLSSAITYTRRLLALEPWREEAHRQLMTRLARSGQRAAALAQFETCRRVLAEELAVEPDAETVALVAAIRGGDFDKEQGRQGDGWLGDLLVSLSPLASPALPISPTPLIGREREVAELGELIGNPHCRLITLMGGGGMGKTRLALAAATAQANNFRHGTAFVSLATISDPTFMAHAVLQALEQPLQGSQNPQAQLLSYLRDKEILLVLDNYEQLLPDVALLTKLLGHAAGVKLLVTSRERLALQAEQLFQIEGLNYPNLAANGTVEDFAACQLFLQRARQIKRDFVLNSETRTAIVRICAACEGLPLALELAAGSLRTQSVLWIAEAVAANQPLPSVRLRDLPARHTSIQAVFEHSWRLLTAQEQAVLTRLSVFRAGFTLAAAEKVAGTDLETIATLLDKSLVRQQSAERFDLHELLRQFAAEKLKECCEKTTTQQRRLDYFLALAQNWAPQMYGTNQEELLIAFGYEHNNFRAALTWGFTSDDGDRCNSWKAAWLAARLGHFWYACDYWSEGRMWLAKALSVLDTEPSVTDCDDDIALRAQLLYYAGVLAYAQNDLVNAQHILKASLAIYQSRGDQHATVRCLHELTSIANQLGAYDQATVFIKTTLTLGHSLGDQRLIGRSLLNLSDLATEQGNFQTGMVYASESLAIFRELDVTGANVVGLIGSALVLLAQAAIGLGEYKQALGYLEEAMLVHRGAQKKVGPWRMRVLGLVHQMLGNYEPAIDAYRDSLIMRHAREEISGMAWALEGLGEATALLGQFRRATVLWGAATTLRKECGSPIGHGDLPRHESIVRLVQNQLTVAAFTSAWTKGAAMSTTQMVAYALADSDQ